MSTSQFFDDSCDILEQATFYFLGRKISLLLNEHQQLLPTLSQLTACGCSMIKEWLPHASSACVTTDLCVP